MTDAPGQTVERARSRLLWQVGRWLDGPMLVLAVVWLVLLIVELTRGLAPWAERLGTAVWIIFILDFALRFALAPRKLRYLRRNWITALALALPALRVLRLARTLRILRAARTVRGVRLARVLTSFSRGMASLRRTMTRRRFGYVVVLTAVVISAGAAGMYAFESGAHPTGFSSYGDALWWTAMLVTTIGSEAWPRTPEGRILGFLLSVYSIGIIGYVTATLATFFVQQDDKPARSRADAELRAVRKELAALRLELSRRGNEQ